jgi:predicted dehydrogenase
VDLLVHDRAEAWEHRYEPAPGGRGSVLSKGKARQVALAGPEPLRAELEDFVQCAQSGRTPVADAASGLRAVELLEAAQRSAREGRAVPPR